MLSGLVPLRSVDRWKILGLNKCRKKEKLEARLALQWQWAVDHRAGKDASVGLVGGTQLAKDLGRFYAGSQPS